MTAAIDLRITSIRNRGEFGGAIVAGEHADTKRKYVVTLDYPLLRDANSIQKGQTWRVEGPVNDVPLTLPHGQVIIETNLSAKTAILLSPNADNLIAYLAENPTITGVGQVKASKLYARFGTELLPIIRSADIERLQEIVTEASALAIVASFKELDFTSSLLYLDTVGLPRSIGQKVLAAFGTDTQEKIKEDPYRLLSFCANWKIVDGFALNQCGVQVNSSARLFAAVEESLYRCFDSGSTAANKSQLTVKLRQLLNDAGLVRQALNLGESSGQYYRTEYLYHPAGAWLMERFIAERIYTIHKSNTPAQLCLTNNLSSIESIIDNFEMHEGYQLTPEQREAVLTSTTNRFSLILGGAGVGKTTVLKCIYTTIQVLEPFWTIYQLALSGKAAKRMQEATGMDSYTIASFLCHIKTEDIPENAWIAVDEASMVDVITFYRLLRHIPESCRIILIGDQYQLPPVGSGLILHALVDSDLPQTTLKVVKRQSEASGIPLVAAAIRDARWPALSPYPHKAKTGVSFVCCPENQINQTVLDVYGELGGSGLNHDIQILSPTRSGVGGVDTLNVSLQNTFKTNEPSIGYVDEEFGSIDYLSASGNVKLNDLVIYTKNDYKRGLRNGSLGKIIQRFIPTSVDSAVCLVQFDELTVELTALDLANIELAYAITVHKSQGSQFRRVIIPIRKCRLLDLTLLYTAITRAVEQVVLVGDESVARHALTHVSAQARTVGLQCLANKFRQ
ncbi:hypothetical protein A9Q81_21930 [Gammaproteobacteria bacterium 42_54_T18]|nr:hypothetical protein A9Q81_21930 [Gammaproteobacteria bacterium 42_54_T18]